jgi:beta-lactamase class A
MRQTFLFSFLSAVFMLTDASVAAAQMRDSTAVERRAAQIGAAMNGRALEAESVFAPAFLLQLPTAQLRDLFAKLASQYGATTSISALGPGAAAGTNGVFRVSMSKGYSIRMTVNVRSTLPNLVDGLFFGNASKEASSLEDLMREFSLLPGSVSALAARVDRSTVAPIASLRSTEPLAIGSAFKLFVLAELVRQVDAGKHRWNEVVSLDSISRSLPSGILQRWPIGTPVTLQTLASLMISQSDNTAADMLLHLLGRVNVETVQGTVGSSHAQRNMPFLTTRELFALKSPDTARTLDRYLSGSADARRRILSEIDRLPISNVKPDFSAGPVAIDSVEWFASAEDLARTMMWLKYHTERGVGAAAREILAINPGLTWPASAWTYVGFKGGSEPGVLDLTFLLRRADDQWFVFTATWNDSKKAVDEAAFVALVERAVELLGQHAKE